MVSQVYEIDTPENVRFRFERAGLASRAVAWGVDVIAMGFLLQLGTLVVAPFELVAGSAAQALLLVIAFLVQWWYGALAEWRFHGRTVGKWVVGLAVRDDRGLPLTLYQATIRNLLRIVDLLPGLYLVGGVASLVDPSGRRLGDLAAGTVVIRESHHALPTRGLAEAQRDLVHYPALADAGRRLSPPERDAVLALCAQRDRLPLELRIELCERLAAHLAQRFALVRPAHLSGEKLVLYVGAALVGTTATRRTSLPRTAHES